MEQSARATTTLMARQLQMEQSARATTTLMARQLQMEQSARATTTLMARQLQMEQSARATTTLMARQLQVEQSTRATMNYQQKIDLCLDPTSTSTGLLRLPAALDCLCTALCKHYAAYLQHSGGQIEYLAALTEEALYEVFCFESCLFERVFELWGRGES